MTYQEMVAEFYAAKCGGLPKSGLALSLFEEEVHEWMAALPPSPNDPVSDHEVKEMADVLYTLVGVALSRGIDLDGAFKAVHESNMTKQPTLNGKVQKGPDYVEPDMRPFIRGA
jgi:predicted HAD superfamily Cof-like phosphohydrolase